MSLQTNQSAPSVNLGDFTLKHGNLGGFKLLRGSLKEGQCAECATVHPPEAPHNQQSLFWQYSFREKNGRWPTWSDALAHCTPDVRKQWVAELAKYGINVPEAE